MFIYAAAGCSTHLYTLIFYRKLSFTCHPYNQSEPCVNWNRASVNRHGWGAKKKTCLSLIQLGGVFFLCHFCVFLKKMIYIRYYVCKMYIYIQSMYKTRVPINESPYFLHPQSATAASAVITTTAYHEGRSNISSDVIFWLLF